MRESILVVEDEAALRTTLTVRLRSEGYVVNTAADGKEGYDKAIKIPYDLMILDIMLPFLNGLDLCRDIRKAGLATPVLLLTARNQIVDKVVGLKLGADDYVTKPFDAAELVARIEALLRRQPFRPGQGIYIFGEIQVDVRGWEVTRDGKPVYLSNREFALLRFLVEHPGEAVSRGELLRLVWGYESDALTRTVDVHVASLRQKLERDSKQPEFIVTVPGVGYKFVGLKGAR
jgi:two-component system alkaline phosphatase synthesis response regulator PhoP